MLALVWLLSARQLTMLQCCVLLEQPKRREVRHANVTLELVGIDEHGGDGRGRDGRRRLLRQQLGLGTGFDFRR